MRRVVEVLLAGRVGQEITAVGFSNVLRKIGERPVHVTLKSNGGCFNQAREIYYRLRERQAKHAVSITAVKASSAAAWILLAADERLITRNGTVFVHNVMEQPSGALTPAELRRRADVAEALSSILADIIAERTGLQRDHVVELLDAEPYMNAARALELGIATAISPAIY